MTRFLSQADILDHLDQLGSQADEEIDLMAGALLLANLTEPETDPSRFEQLLSKLVDATQTEIAMSTAEQERPVTADLAVDALVAVLQTRFGYHGDEQDYDHPDNANLFRVLDRQKGLPIALGILFLHVGKQVGLNLAGLNFPGHFLLRIEGAGGTRCIFDPFHGGVRVEIPELRRMLKQFNGQDAELTPEVYRPVSNREILLRLENNLKVRALRKGQLDQAVLFTEAMRRLAPNRHGFRYEIAMMKTRMDDFRGAQEELEQFLNLTTDQVQRQRAKNLLAEVIEKLNPS